MKATLFSYKHPGYAKAIYWGKLLTLTGGAEMVVQGTGLLTGLLIIKFLSTTEYAYYTIANTVLGMITTLSDGGIYNGVMSQGGKVWQDKTKLGVVLATGLDLRRKFALVILAFSIPILGFLLLRNGASWLTTSLITLALLPSVLATLSDSLLEVVPKLHQQIRALQKNQAIVGVGRLVLSVASLSVLPFTWLAVLINGLVRAYGNLKLMKIAYASAERTARPDPETRQEILRAVKRILPLTIYYCLSGQIIIWIPSLIGNTTSIAQVGALSRLALILNLVSTLMTTLLVPRFARLEVGNKAQMIRLFGYVQFFLLLTSISILSVFALFPTQFLWILGKSYANLEHELLLMVLSSCVGMGANISGNLASSRGWYIHPVVIMSINVFSLVTSLFVFNLSTTVGVLYYNTLLGSISYVVTVGYGMMKMIRTNEHEEN